MLDSAPKVLKSYSFRRKEQASVVGGCIPYSEGKGALSSQGGRGSRRRAKKTAANRAAGGEPVAGGEAENGAKVEGLIEDVAVVGQRAARSQGVKKTRQERAAARGSGSSSCAEDPPRRMSRLAYAVVEKQARMPQKAPGNIVGARADALQHGDTEAPAAVAADCVCGGRKAVNSKRLPCNRLETDRQHMRGLTSRRR